MKLQANLEQLEGYDELYSTLTAWLKTTESQLRSESALKADLVQKEKQQTTLKMIQTDVTAHLQGVQSLQKQAQDIAAANPDSRVLAYAQDLRNRYDAVVTSVAEHLKRVEASVDDHRKFIQLRAHASDWLSVAVATLDDNRDASSDTSSVAGEKLRLVQVRPNFTKTKKLSYGFDLELFFRKQQQRLTRVCSVWRWRRRAESTCSCRHRPRGAKRSDETCASCTTGANLTVTTCSSQNGAYSNMFPSGRPSPER